MKTEVAKLENVKRDWYLVDAQDAVIDAPLAQRQHALAQQCVRRGTEIDDVDDDHGYEGHAGAPQ